MLPGPDIVDGEVDGGPALDTAVSRALLDAVAAGERRESLRLWNPGDSLAFSIADRARPGFARAVDAAAGAGFAPFLRLAGGHAAVYTRETLAFAWAIPLKEPREGIRERFEAFATLMASALRRLGVNARVGAVPGEYCPGDHSVNARGRVKLMGVGQRVVHGAAHVGGVIVVGGSARARAVLEPVYEALALPFDPATVGSIEDEAPGVTHADVREVLVAELARGRALGAAELDATLLERARSLEPRHRIDAPATARLTGRKLASEV